MLNDCTDLSHLPLQSGMIRGEMGISIHVWGRGELRLAKYA